MKIHSKKCALPVKSAQTKQRVQGGLGRLCLGVNGAPDASLAAAEPQHLYVVYQLEVERRGAPVMGFRRFGAAQQRHRAPKNTKKNVGMKKNSLTLGEAVCFYTRPRVLTDN
jgi:hypothetical protein